MVGEAIPSIITARQGQVNSPCRPSTPAAHSPEVHKAKHFPLKTCVPPSAPNTAKALVAEKWQQTRVEGDGFEGRWKSGAKKIKTQNPVVRFYLNGQRRTRAIPGQSFGAHRQSPETTRKKVTKASDLAGEMGY